MRRSTSRRPSPRSWAVEKILDRCTTRALHLPAGGPPELVEIRWTLGWDPVGLRTRLSGDAGLCFSSHVVSTDALEAQGAIRPKRTADLSLAPVRARIVRELARMGAFERTA